MLKRLAPGLAVVVAVFIMLPATTALADGTQVLAPDPNIWCVNNNPFTAQVDAGWTIQYDDVVGDPADNNMQCNFLEMATVGGVNEDADTFTVPYVFHQYIPVNYAEACQQQFPGSSLQWSPAGYAGWECTAPADAAYPAPSA